MTQRCVLLTRAREDESQLRSHLTDQGLRVLQWPGVQLQPLELPGGEAALGEALRSAEVIVFPSPGAVRCTWAQWPALGSLLGALGLRIYAQGPGTRAALEARGVLQVTTPLRTDAIGLADRIHRDVPPGTRVVLMVGNLAGDVLPRRLAAAGLSVARLVVYENRPPEDLAQPQCVVDCAVYGSPSAARNHLQNNPWLHAVPGVAYGPTTADWLMQNGDLPRVIVAEGPTWSAVFEAVNHVLKGSTS